MLEEAIEVIRDLWRGEVTSYLGEFYTVENARLYTLPDDHFRRSTSPPAGSAAAELAGRIGDGLIGTGPDRKLLDAFEGAGGSGPRYGQVTLCWADTEKAARRTAHEWWPTAAIPGEATQELPNPAHFEQLAEIVTEDMVAEVHLMRTGPGGPPRRRSARTSTPATTTSTCTRSVLIRPGSSGSRSESCCQPSRPRRPGLPEARAYLSRDR